MGVYLVSGAMYLGMLFAGRGTADGWAITTLLTFGFVGWITVVNLLYLIVQLVMASDDCRLSSAMRSAMLFVRYDYRTIAAVFAIELAIVMSATGASLLATAALGLIAFVPFLGLAVLPLQLLAWVLRGVVFQYVGLASIGMYLKLYREHREGLAAGRVPYRHLHRAPRAVAG
jgi:hypothetical protein